MKKYLTILAIIIIILGAFYFLGYRVGTFGIGKQGHIEMTVPFANTDIFADEEKKLTTSDENEKVSIALTPTEHQIIVSRGGYLPWAKKVRISQGERISLIPLFVTSNATGEIITNRDPNYSSIKNAVTRASLPTKENPRLSTDTSTEMWVEANTILIQRGGQTTTVIAPEPVITAAEFYKDRPDVLIFSAGTTIFAIETDANPENIQNLLPIFTGQTPKFTINDNNSIYVLDGTLLMAVVI
jgi:hypothetical protein